jgi:hypothetical protein
MCQYVRVVRLLAALTLFASAALATADKIAPPAAAPPRDGIAKTVADSQEAFWQKIATAEPGPTVSTRSFYTYALALCESRQHPERLERLFKLAASVQDRDAGSPGYGNFKWFWRDSGVTDTNSVEFCMHDALRIWLVHRDWLPKPANKLLLEALRYGGEGALRHRVATSYTNIALLNAANLVGLGEALGRPQWSDEGYRRFDAFYLYTWQFGIHEYCSPTYYVPDLSGLLFIESKAKRESARQQARALLRLFWTDITLNWFGPSQKLGGSQSRSYNYLYGLGGIDSQMWLAGWLLGPLPETSHILTTIPAKWSPPDELFIPSHLRQTRLIRQRWGVKSSETRTHFIHPDVSLGTSGAAYGSQDLPLTIDLPGSRTSARSYFIADGREDPYGKIRYETSSAKHMKALHLLPFWAAAQSRDDAVGLVVYRPQDLTEPNIVNLQSHLVLRRDVDGFWLRGKMLSMKPAGKNKPVRMPIEPGDALVLRKETAAVGIRVLWTRGQDGQPASIALVDDGNTFGVVRLTIEHRHEARSAEAAAAIWVRIGSGLAGDDAFEAWSRRFQEAQPIQVEASTDHLGFAVPSDWGPVAVSADAPFGQGRVTLQPAPPAGILELNDREIGRPLLDGLEPALSCKISQDRPVKVPATGSVRWEAEDGLVFPSMAVSEDKQASGGRYLWEPLPTDGIGRPKGYALWPLEIVQAGKYYLWARTLAPTSETDSFFFDLSGESATLAPKTAWSAPHTDAWRWHRVALEKSRAPVPLELPAGRVWLQITTREPGAKIDCLLLTSDVQEQPKD